MNVALEDLKKFNQSLNEELKFKPQGSSISPLFELRSLLSQLKEAENFLREAENKFQRVFYGSHISKAIIGTNDKVIEVNEEFLALFGYERQELNEKDWKELLRYDFVEDAVANNNKLLHGQEKFYACDQVLIDKAGNEIKAFVNVVVVDSYVEKPLFYLVEIVDLMRIEQRLKNFQEILSGTPRERTEFE